MEENTIRFNVQLEAEDYIHFNYFHTRKSRRKTNIFFGIFFAIPLIVSIIIVSWTGDFSRLQYTGLPSCILFGLILVLNNVSPRLASKKYLQSNKTLLDPVCYEILKEGIKVTYENGYHLIKWDEVYSVAESERIIAIYTSINQAHIIPKNHIKDIRELKDILRANIDKKKLNLRK